MKEKVVDNIMNNIKNNNSNLSSTKLAEIRYGLYGLYSLLTKTSVVILLAIVLNIFKEFIIFLIFYSLLRGVGYGCHAKTNLQCWIFSTVLLLGIPLVSINIHISENIKIIMWLILFINFLAFAPADTKKRPMINKIRKLKFKSAILLLSFIYLYLIIKYENISNLVIGSMVLEGFLVNPLGYILMGQKVRSKLNNINLFKQKIDWR